MASEGASTVDLTVASSETSIDDLPEDILIHILSFLPTIAAVRTTAVARRWQNLWHLVPILNFDVSEFHARIPEISTRDARHLFAVFIGQTLIHRPHHVPIGKLKLFSNYRNDEAIRLCVDGWLMYAILCEATELKLEFDWDQGENEEHVGELHLVDSFALDEQIKNMMAFCVNLEILSILDIRGLHNLRIVSNKLKHFKLSYFGFVEGDSLQLCAPSLESVTFDNVFGRKYALKDSSCLVEAHLDFGSRGWEEFVCWTYLVRFLSSVKRLCIQNMWNWFPDYVDIKRQPEDCSFEQPMTSEEGRHGKIGEEVFSRRFGFGNLKHLELLFGYSKDDLLGLEILLQNCPQLETMVLVNSYPSHCDGGLQKL
ncbi:OLC1v1006684C2 [Oldenlandia corymbosa var. corymbosa]|uniref:OLC1v1006684C2 n=1 Tax=Oldenlandia corymbosa var. corymbosa TaxID=529605 RepID=A0AAV1DKZ8_OLDCO|nr:OLC1v1006684C2 [Oldenlandia corymbosa var. corymbosa]